MPVSTVPMPTDTTTTATQRDRDRTRPRLARASVLDVRRPDRAGRAPTTVADIAERLWELAAAESDLDRARRTTLAPTTGALAHAGAFSEGRR
jgi:hypothetical protein